MLLALMFVCLFVGNEALKFEVKFSPTQRQWWRHGLGSLRD